MPDENPPQIEETEPETETPVVEVTVQEGSENPEPESEIVVEDGDTTVVVETEDTPGVSEPELDRWLELERWKTQMESTILGLATAAGAAQAEAEEAAEAADQAEAVASDAFEEAKQETETESEHEEDAAPTSARVHPWFESRSERRERRANR